MVKRAKLTLKHTEKKEHIVQEKVADSPESPTTKQAISPDSKRVLSKKLILVALTITSLIIFRQKVF